MASKFGGQAVDSKFGGVPVEPERPINSGLQFAQKLAQGATFGFGDEISAGMVGAAAALTGGNFRDAYNYALGNIRADEAEFAKQNPKIAIGAEIAGAVLTGGMAGGRVLSQPAMANLSTAGRYGRIAGVGAAEGALYGAGTGTDDRADRALTGFLVGAVAAPVGAKLMDLAVRGVGTTASYAARKLGDTPKDQAIRAIRAAAEAEGIDADDAVRMLDQLGPQATIADLGENFRSLARAATDQSGAFKTEARNLMNTRQLGQQQRILDAAEVAAGQRGGNFNVARQLLVESRKDAAKPLYDSAFLNDIKLTTNLAKVLMRPDLKSAMNKAQRMAANEGDEIGENLLKRIHYAKMDLDDKIGAAVRAGAKNRVRILTTLKDDLLREVDSLSSDYRQARNIFSSDSKMIGAMDEGVNLFKLSVDEMAEAMKGMTASEKDLFRLGAVRAIKDQLDNTSMTHDATRKLISTQAMREKLGMIFPEPEDFIKKTLAEAEFSRTRQILTGGSPTAERLAGQQSLVADIQPDLVGGLVSNDPIMAGRALLGIFTKNKVTPEVINQLANTMLEQGMNPAQIRRTFAAPTFRNAIGSSYDRVVLPTLRGSLGGVSGALVPENAD